MFEFSDLIVKFLIECMIEVSTIIHQPYTLVIILSASQNFNFSTYQLHPFSLGYSLNKNFLQFFITSQQCKSFELFHSNTFLHFSEYKIESRDGSIIVILFIFNLEEITVTNIFMFILSSLHLCKTLVDW